jgi:hypothetical protein
VLRSVTPSGHLMIGEMPAAAVTRDRGRPAIVQRKGLELPQRLSFEKWIGIGHQLAAQTTSTAWCLGDWLAYGETAFTGRYREALERTSLEYQTLRNYAWVAKRFTMSRRRDSLSFGHHAEVASLGEPEQEYWLRKAEELGWSRNRLRVEVRSSLRERAAASPPEQELPGEADMAGPGRETAYTAAAAGDANPSVIFPELTLKIPISAEQMKICQVAAVTHGLTLEEWVLRELEEAAHRALSLAVQ